jgi:hypothetical protein
LAACVARGRETGATPLAARNTGTPDRCSVRRVHIGGPHGVGAAGVCVRALNFSRKYGARASPSPDGRETWNASANIGSAATDARRPLSSRGARRLARPIDHDTGSTWRSAYLAHGATNEEFGEREGGRMTSTQ